MGAAEESIRQGTRLGCDSLHENAGLLVVLGKILEMSKIAALSSIASPRTCFVDCTGRVGQLREQQGQCGAGRQQRRRQSGFL